MQENTQILIPTTVDGLWDALVPRMREVVKQEVEALRPKKDVYVKTIDELCAFLTNGSDKPYSRTAVCKILANKQISKGCIGESVDGVRIYNATKLRDNLVKDYDKRVFNIR